jgi:hypothetical protein
MEPAVSISKVERRKQGKRFARSAHALYSRMEVSIEVTRHS